MPTVPPIGRDFFTCGHCGLASVGYAKVEDQTVCHPAGGGMDCYRLVTVYGHVMPCGRDGCVASRRLRLVRERDLVVTEEEPATSDS